MDEEQDYFSEYLEHYGADIQDMIIMGGIERVLESYETWMIEKGYLKPREEQPRENN
jgi:hypothetical protein